VNKLTAQGVPLEEAVEQAFTARAAASLGFSNIASLEATPPNAPGKYTHIEVLFTR
jgi:hypothetical protein